MEGGSGRGVACGAAIEGRRRALGARQQQMASWQACCRASRRRAHECFLASTQGALRRHMHAWSAQGTYVMRLVAAIQVRCPSASSGSGSGQSASGCSARSKSQAWKICRRASETRNGEA